MAERVECAVIGAGVVGLACARALAKTGREVVVLEAETAFGTHTSSRNSEVIHAGIYYPTGSLKARLRVLEPEVACVAGVLSPSTGIVDSHGLMLAYLGEAQEHGAALALASPVVAGRTENGDIVLEVGGAEPVTLRARAVINAAGFNAPAVARSIAGIPPATIPPAYYAIGHYYTLTGRTPFRRLVYPVARRDWLGVHVTIDLGGRVKFGPDISWIGRVDYHFDESREDAFYKAIRDYYPGLKDGTLQPGYTGIRPKIHGPGESAPDFLIQGPRDHGVAGLVNLYGIESPGLTASLAIADDVAALLAYH